MIVPRRVPWATSQEFHHIFSCLFDSDGATSAQRYGIDRVRPTFPL